MIRMLRRVAALCALLCLLGAVPAGAQSVPDTQDLQAGLARAQKLLDEMVRLLDKMEARQAAGRSRTGTTPKGAAPTPGAAADVEGWRTLFDGTSLAGWKRTDFTGGGEVKVEKSYRGGPAAIVVEAGRTLSGFNWTGDVPRTNFEVALEMMKIKGSDFPCGLTFPVDKSYATLILGGWGGQVVGISSIDGQDASENETTKVMNFPPDRWYRVRMRVTPDKLEAWLDDEKIVDQVITGRRIGLRFGPIDQSVPLGISTYQTSAAFRAIRLRTLSAR